MTLNFGKTPWKNKPVDDYIGFHSAPDKHVSQNSNEGSSVLPRKIEPNAPLAIIIEVLIDFSYF